jgi:quinol monooxygenase YgiN
MGRRWGAAGGSFTAMPRIAHIVKVTAAEGRRDEASAVLGRLVDAAESEPGTLEYTIYADTTDAVTIWITELYADEAALNAHMSSPTMAEIAGLLGGLVDGPADVRRLEIVRRKGDSPG